MPRIAPIIRCTNVKQLLVIIFQYLLLVAHQFIHAHWLVFVDLSPSDSTLKLIVSLTTLDFFRFELEAHGNASSDLSRHNATHRSKSSDKQPTYNWYRSDILVSFSSLAGGKDPKSTTRQINSLSTARHRLRLRRTTPRLPLRSLHSR